jgi:hypothetical protein
VTRTATITPTFATNGPTIVRFGVARADGQVTQPDLVAGDGTPIYLRPLPQGFFVFVEVRRGPSNRDPGQVVFNSVADDPNALPDLQIVASRPLGNGSTRVCDDANSPPIGGVPAVNPPMFGGTQASANAINDLACRFDFRGTSDSACTRNASQEAAFIFSNSRAQYCTLAGVGAELAFPTGDTRLTARVRDVVGAPGQPASIIIRVAP